MKLSRNQVEQTLEHSVQPGRVEDLALDWLELYAENERLRMERERYRAALESLIDKMQRIYDSTEYKGVWQMAQIHNGPYEVSRGK